ncbi:MAG: VOC family protein [Candidatus Dormibacteria bacterium]
MLRGLDLRRSENLTRSRLELGIDSADPLGLAPFWEVALGYLGGSGDGDPYRALTPPEGGLPVFLQREGEPKVTKNRSQVDLFVTDPDRPVSQLLELAHTWWELRTVTCLAGTGRS